MVMLAGLTGCGGSDPVATPAPTTHTLSVNERLEAELTAVGAAPPQGIVKWRESFEPIVCGSTDEVLRLMVAMNRDQNKPKLTAGMRAMARAVCPEKLSALS